MTSYERKQELEKKNVKINFTDLLSYQNIISENSINKCKEYTENFDGLKKLLSELEITIRYQGISKWNNSDNETMLINVMITKKGHNPINFDFHMSYHDTAAFNILNCKVNSENSRKYYKCLFPFSDRNNYYKFYESIIYRTEKVRKEQKNIKNGLLYSILCCIKSDYCIDNNFNDFCSEFGYDTDSIKDRNLHDLCLKQSKLLKMVFSENDIELLTD